MAYAYQQNLNGGASRGYIKYNITPAIGQPIGVGDTLSINGEMYISNQTTRSFSLMFGYLGVNTDAGNPGWLRDAYTVLTIAKTCNKGKKAYFSITYKVEEALLTGGTLASGVSVPGGTPDENGLFNLYMCFSMNWSGGPIWSLGNNNHRFRAIAARRAPTAGTPVLTDLYGEVSGGQTPLEYFGGYVQGESLPRLTATFATDGRDTKLTATHALDITGGTPAQDLHLSVQTAAGATEVIFDLPALDCSGTLTYAYTVTDSAGVASTAVTGTLTVLAYSPPDISAFSLQRYKSVIGQGDVAADDGTRLWFTYTGTVQAVAGLNAWTLKLDYEVQDSGSPATQAITGGADGAVTSYANSKLLYDTHGLTFSSASTWSFTAVLSDLFNTVQRVVTVIKAGAYFNVEKNGVAVGQRSTGTANDKKFEVAADYESHFYGGIEGVTNYASGEVATGGTWIDGKPIYRYIFTGTVAQSTTGTVTVGNVGHNIERLINYYGSFRDMREAYYRPLPVVNPGVDSSRIGVSITLYLNGDVRFSIGSYWTGAKEYIIIVEYTKA